MAANATKSASITSWSTFGKSVPRNQIALSIVLQLLFLIVQPGIFDVATLAQGAATSERLKQATAFSSTLIQLDDQIAQLAVSYRNEMLHLADKLRDARTKLAASDAAMQKLGEKMEDYGVNLVKAAFEPPPKVKVAVAKATIEVVLNGVVQISSSLKSLGQANGEMDAVAARLKLINPQIDQLNSLAARRDQTVKAAQLAGLFAERPADSVASTSPSQGSPPAVQPKPSEPPALAGTFTIPTAPDPVAISLLHEAYIGLIEPLDVERRSTRAAANAFAKCMIEHRTMNVMVPNELWEFLTHSAYILKSKNALGVFWPVAQRYRTYPDRSGFEFRLTKKTWTRLTERPVNALSPRSLEANGMGMAVLVSLIREMGLSEPTVCMASAAARRPNSNPVEGSGMPDD
jgi:hypothetical protein